MQKLCAWNACFLIFCRKSNRLLCLINYNCLRSPISVRSNPLNYNNQTNGYYTESPLGPMPAYWLVKVSNFRLRHTTCNVVSQNKQFRISHVVHVFRTIHRYPQVPYLLFRVRHKELQYSLLQQFTGNCYNMFVRFAAPCAAWMAVQFVQIVIIRDKWYTLISL